MDETPVAGPESTSSEKVAGNLSPNVAAALATAFPIIGGLVFLVLEKRNKFVRFWAMQAVLLGLVWFVVRVILVLGHLVLGHLPFIGGLMNFVLGALYWVFGLAWLAVYIVCIVKAYSKVEWEIPGLGKLARQQIAKLDRDLAPAPASTTEPGA